MTEYRDAQRKTVVDLLTVSPGLSRRAIGGHLHLTNNRQLREILEEMVRDGLITQHRDPGMAHSPYRYWVLGEKPLTFVYEEDFIDADSVYKLDNWLFDQIFSKIPAQVECDCLRLRLTVEVVKHG